MTPLSRYRVRAREEIELVLGALPEGATPEDARRYLRPLSMNWRGAPPWVYQCYLRERKAALLRRFPDPEQSCRVEEVRHLLAPRVPGDTVPWLSVVCGWCGGTIAGGCLQCVELHQQVDGVVRDPEFLALRKGLWAKPEEWGILADWLAERGIDVEVWA